MREPARQTIITVAKPARPEGKRAVAPVTGSPLIGSGGNTYEAAATSQYDNGGLRTNSSFRNWGTTQLPVSRIWRAHCATMASWSPRAGPPSSPPKQLRNASAMIAGQIQREWVADVAFKRMIL